MARRILGKTAVSMKTMIYGKEGARKSNTAIQFATLKGREGKPLKVLLIDLEFKAIEGFNESWLESKEVDFGNICEIRTRDLSVVSKLCDLFTQGKPIPMLDENDRFTKEFEQDAEGNPFIADVLVLDSISVINDLLVEGRNEIAKKRTNIKIAREGLYGDEKELALENSGLQFIDYAKLRTIALKIVRDLQAVTGKHVIYVARAKDAKESKLIGGKIESLDLGYELMDATAFKFLPYEVSLIVHTKNEDGEVSYTIEKDSTGVHPQGAILYEFNIKDYEDYINNKNRSQLLHNQSYKDVLSVAQTFAEDSEEGSNDDKMKTWKSIMMFFQNNPNDLEKRQAVMGYLAKKGIPFGNIKKPELIALDDLTEIKAILNIQ